MDSEEDCKCLKISGHLDAVKWLQWPREYRPSHGYLALQDWKTNPHIWLHYVESADGQLPEDDILKSVDTQHWSIHDVQRYFVGELHCETVLFTYQYPNLRMPTRLGSFFWKTNVSLKLPSALYLKEFNRSLEVTLKKMEAEKAQMDRIIISDQLIKLDKLDYFKRKTFLRIFENLLGLQKRLQLVSLENLGCKRLEGVRLIQQLACFNADTLKYLFLWRFVLPNENPILINYSYITGTGQYIPRPPSKQCFLRSLGELRNLRLLALEYAHIADGTGGALMTLLPVINKPHFRLQLLCREDHIPGRADAALGVGGHDIPDTAWRRVLSLCPDLYILMAFYCIRDYDNVRRFLTPSIPLREVHLQLGIDLKMRQRQDSDISCFVRHIAHYYGCNLVTLSIHQWRFALFPLRRVFELMPHLVRFHYVGRVEDEIDLRRMMQIIACGACEKLKQLDIRIQDDKAKREYWCAVTKTLTEKFKEILAFCEVDFCLKLKQLDIRIQDDKAKREYWCAVTKTLTEKFKEILAFCEVDFCLSVYKN